MPGTRKRAPVGRPVYFCDECGQTVLDDTGYLAVEKCNGRNRWRVFHDKCRNAASVRRSGDGANTPVIVRLSRVATYPLLLTTMASLASDVIGFETTNWPTLLCRIASDSEWNETHGRKRARDFDREDKAVMQEAFGKR